MFQLNIGKKLLAFGILQGLQSLSNQTPISIISTPLNLGPVSLLTSPPAWNIEFS